jgi:uncharacterized repeat protein (TIGR01451 family)
VEVKISGPPQATVGQKVRFDITLINRGQTTATGLTITDTFDPGLVNEKAPGRNQMRFLIGDDLRPGTDLATYIEFVVAKAGRLGHTVEVTGAGGLRATAQSSLTAVDSGATVPPGPVGPGLPTQRGAGGAVAVQMIAKPGNMEVGDNSARIDSAAVGQFVLLEIDVTNRGLQRLTNVKVTATLDPALTASQATSLEPAARPDSEKSAKLGFHKEASGISWALVTLAPGQTEQLGILCRCEQPATQAYSRVQVTSQEQIVGEGQLGLPIRAAGAGTPSTSGMPGGGGGSVLGVTVRAGHEPITVGGDVSYSVTLDNTAAGASEERAVVVSVEVPPEMTPVRFGTTGPTAPSFQGQVVTFEPLARMAPGESRVYRVHVQAGNKSGTVRVRASVTSQSLREPKTDQTSTLINPAAGG